MSLHRSGRYKWPRVIALLVCFLLVFTTVAYGAAPNYSLYSTPYYNIYYKPADANALTYARGIESYLPKAYNAALSVIGYDYRYPSQLGKLNLVLYNEKDGAYGYMSPGRNALNSCVFLNTNYLKSEPYAAWGNTIAHETAHIMFFNYAKADRWSPAIQSQLTFLTEALAWYAGDCVYGWADHKASGTMSASYIRSQVKYYSQAMDKTFTWAQTGAAYQDPKAHSDAVLAIWNLRAAGSYLTDDLRGAPSTKLRNLLTTLRLKEGQLRSDYGSTALNAFEDSFKAVYGKYANSAGQFTGLSGTSTNTAYLYGDFYKLFYK